MKSSASSRSVSFLFILTVSLLLGLLIFMTADRNVDIYRTRSSDEVTRVQNVHVQMVHDPESPLGISREYHFQLTADALSHDTYLSFQTCHHYVDVYLEKEPLYSIRPSEKYTGIKTIGAVWVTVPLYREDIGKEIRVVLTPIYENYTGQPVSFLLGSELAVYKMQFYDALPELLLCIANFVVGSLILFIALFFMFRKQHAAEILAPGLLAIVMGLWRFTDTNFSPFLAPENTTLFFTISVSMLTASVILLFRSSRTQVQPGSRKLLDLGAIFAALLLTVQLVLQILGIADLRESLTITHIAIVAWVLIFTASSLYDRLHFKQNRKRKNTAWVLAVGAAADLILYYLRDTASGLLCILTAILLFVILEGFKILYNFLSQERRLVETELSLLRNRSIAMMSQIRSHFIFNILNAISGMCKYDPEKADETVVRFARYLRSNINIMENDDPLPFLTDLQHLEDYIILEQIRFGDKIQFETDIQVDDFALPPLILQPLVENAIKHGLTPKASGGTILLQTRQIGNSVQILVADDGVGFDTSIPRREGAVGLSNIQFRLTHIARGTMQIDSIPGQGTRVTLTIPGKEDLQ